MSSEERSRMIEIAGKERLILSFYQYADIGNPEIFRNNIFIEWNSLNVLGRIYIAKEGINGTFSGSIKDIDKTTKKLKSLLEIILK